MILLMVAIIGSWVAPSYLPPPTGRTYVQGDFYTLPLYRCRCDRCPTRCQR